MVRLLMGVIFLSFIGISGYHAVSYGFTADEIAHLSAAYSYRDGKGLNTEHPPLLKNLNAVYLEFAHPDVSCENEGQWSCSQSLLTRDPDKISSVLIGSRFVFILFNSLAILLMWWLIERKYISASFGIVVSLLYTFSPSFVSHAPILTFDVAGSWLMGASILCWLLSFLHRRNTVNYKEVFHVSSLELVSILVTCGALMVKFSSVVLLPVLGVALVSLVGVYAHRKQRFSIFHILWLSFVGSVAYIGSIFSQYIWGFRSVDMQEALSKYPLFGLFPEIIKEQPLQSITLYVLGVSQSLVRSQDWIPVFVDEGFVYLDYQELITRVMWFKELPLLWLFVLAVCAYYTIRLFKQKRATLDSKTLASLAFVVGFPLLYWVISRSSHLTIGYRHFYPILVFLYGALAWLISRMYIRGGAYVRAGIQMLSILFVVSGLLAVPAGLSYVNFLWRKPVYSLASDSTIAWGQYEYSAITHLYNNGELPQTNDNVIVFATWDQVIVPSNHLLRLRPEWDAKEAQTYDNRVELDQTNLTESDYKYIALDVWVLQEALDIRESNSLVQENLEYLETLETVQSYSNVYWVFKTR